MSTFKINGKTVGPPKNWRDIQVIASFDDGRVQPNISVSEFVFANKEALVIKDHLFAGGAYEGLPFEILEGAEDVFKGIIDLTEGFKLINTTQAQVKIKDKQGLNDFSLRAQALSFSFLADQGKITNADYLNIPYVVEKRLGLAELAIISISSFLLVREIVKTVPQVPKEILDVKRAAIGFPANIGNLLIQIADLFLLLIYIAIIVVEVIKFINELSDLILSEVRYHRGMTLRKLLEKGAEELGLVFKSSIVELDTLAILPRKTKQGSIRKNRGAIGVPTSGEATYTLGQLLTVCRGMFAAELKITEKEVFLEPLNNDTFWLRTANYVFPDILSEDSEWNIGELRANKLITFETDVNDDFTLDEFTGTTLEVITDVLQIKDKKNKSLKGLTEIRFPFALGVKKDGLTDVEKALKSLLSLADTLISLFGGRSRFAGRVKERRRMLKMSSDLVNVPKLLRINADGSLQERSQLSSRYLYDNYINDGSFVDNNFRGQWRVFKAQKIGFGLGDFIKVIKNGYFYTQDGRIGKFESVKWQVDSNFAIVDYRIRDVFTKNLKETLVEP